MSAGEGAAMKKVDRLESVDDKNRTVANRYRIEKKLSKDKNGKTYLVVDLKNNDELKVIKMVNLCLMDRNEVKETMREENVLSKLDNPYIVKYYESFMNDDSLCIITEYCDGGDLDQRLKKMRKDKIRFPEEKIVYWLAQIASAAYYLHSRKILHRNIKPGNIFIKNGMLKLGDFGISRMLKGNSEDAITFIGTPYYMSPEVVKNDPYNAKSDVWSIGCLLYEMCTFQRPFIGDTIYEVFNAIIKEEPPSIINVYSQELNTLLKKMLTKKASERLSSLELINEPLVSDHVKSIIMRSLREANEPDKIAALINSMSHLNEFITDDDFGVFDSKSTI